MGFVEGLWDAVRPASALALAWIRRRPWLHKPMHAVAVKLAKRRVFSTLIKEVLEEQYLTAYDYDQWVEKHDTLTEAERAGIAAHVARMARTPTISVIMPAYNSDERFLREAIASVRGQLYPHWELCVADDASTAPHVWAVLQEAAAEDSRIKIVRRAENGHISAASNSALALATGEFVALMDHDDLLAPHALYEVAAELELHPDADMLFSDEDKVDETGRRREPYFKPGWNPELLLGQNVVKHLVVVRRSLMEAVGGLRVGFEGSQDWDLALRVSEATTAERIRHIPAILYHWRQQEGLESFSTVQLARCQEAARRAVLEHLARTGAAGSTIEILPKGDLMSLRRPVPEPPPLVSVIVPTRDRAELLERCVEGVLNGTDYRNLELLIVDNDSVEPATHALFEKLKAADSRVRVLPAPGPFNYARINNGAVREARGEILLLLNNDVVLTDAGWLSELVAQAARPEVGAVGALLFYEDGRVQHGGVILGVGGDPPVAGHLYAGARTTMRSYFGHLRLARNVSAVTAACLAMRKSVFDQVGGFDEENLAVAFNDVDLCLKIRAAGYQVIWTPRAAMTHLESASRGADTHGEASRRFGKEIAHMRARWGEVLDNDPYYGPNFDPAHVDYRLASPPRRTKPWLRAR